MNLSYSSTRITSVYASGSTQDPLPTLDKTAFEAMAATINGRTGANGALSYSLAEASFAVTGSPQYQVTVEVGLPMVSTGTFDSLFSMLQPFNGTAGTSTWTITFQNCLFTTEYQNAVTHDSATILSDVAFESVATTINSRTGSNGSVLFTFINATFLVSDNNGQPQAAVLFGCQLNPVNNTTMDALVTTLQAVLALNVTPPSGLPSAPTGLTANPISSTEIDLSFSYGGGDATGFTILHSLDNGVTYSTLATIGPSPQSYPNTGLTASTTYYYEVEVTTANGTSLPSAPAHATTQAGSGAPAAPSSLTATPTGSTTMILAYVDNSNNELNFSVERSPHGTSTYSVIGTPAANTTTYNDSGLTASTAYDYRVRAIGSGGNSAYSNVATGTTTSASAPNAPTMLFLQGVSPTEVDIAFADTNVGTATYQIDRSPDNSTWTTMATIPGSPPPLAFVQGHTANTLYYYRISAWSGGLQSGYLTGTVTTLTASGSLPGPPTGLTATAWNPTTVSLSATGVVSSLFTFIQRSADSGSTWKDIARLTASGQASPFTYVDGGLTPNTAYEYRMTNMSWETGTGSASSPVSITTPSAFLSLTAPTGLSTTVNSPCSVTVFWTPQTDRKEDGFYVERSADGGTTWRTVAFNLVRGATWFTDIGLAPSVSYMWRVTSFNGRAQTGYQSWSFANSATSSTTSAATPAADSDPIPAAPSGLSAMAYSDTIVSLEFLLNDQNEAGTKIEISTNGGSTWTEILVLSKWLWQQYVTGLVAGTSYQFRTRTFSGGGNSAYSSAASVTTLASGHTFTADLGLASAPPQALLTPQQLAIYRQMQADYNANPSSPATWGGQTFKYLLGQAAPELTNSGYTYLDMGFAAALMYQITGNATYAQGAFVIATTLNSSYGGWIGYAGYNNDLPGDNTNFQRANGLNFVLIYDWCKGAWSSAQRQYFALGLRCYSKNVESIDSKEYVGGYAYVPANSQLNVNSSQGPYAMLIAYDTIVSLADDPQGGTLQWQCCPMGATTPPFALGGQQPTSSSRTSTVNTILSNYGVCSAGGVGMESSEYNIASDATGARMIEALRHIRGLQGDHAEYYPDLRSSTRLAVLANILSWSGDLGQVWQWGDDQDPRQLGGNGSTAERVQTLSNIAGCARNNATLGPFAYGFLQELWDKNGTAPAHGATLDATNEPYHDYFTMFQPYGTQQPRSALPNYMIASGMGAILYHTGYGLTDSFFVSLVAPNNGNQHPPYSFGDWQLHSQGEWCVTHPIWYGSLEPEAECANSMLHGGLSSGATFNVGPANFYGFRGPVAQEVGSSPTFTYQCGLHWGPVYSPAIYYEPPPEFIHEHSHSIVYLPSSDGKSDTIVTFDRTLEANPNFLPSYPGAMTTGIDRYMTSDNPEEGMSDQQRITVNPIQYPATSPTITGTPALKQWILHCMQQPTISGSTVTWGTDFGGSNMKLVSLAPSGATIMKFDETVLWNVPCCQVLQPMTSTPQAGIVFSPEERWQVRVWPATAWPGNSTPVWDVFCQVVFRTNASGGPTVSATQVTSNSSEVTGPLIHRSSLNDTLLLFSQIASTWNGTVTTFNRVLTSGYTVTWTSTTSLTDVILFDLSTSKSWTKNVDGAGATSLTVSSAGVAQISVSGASSHTIVLVAS